VTPSRSTVGAPHGICESEEITSGQRDVHGRLSVHRNLRGLQMWESAVNESGSLKQHDVIAALDHARIPQGPEGPAEMVPGQHHVRMNMYIARSENGTFEVVENLGHIDPKECEVPLG
jgi:hypothetical protein